MAHTNCSVYGCLSTPKYNKDVKFHRFPRDARCKLWIEACQRPDLRKKNTSQLYNMHVCSLHFETWMYMKTKLKSAAIPILNLPSASLHPMSTQTGAPRIKIRKDLHRRSVQNQTDVTPVGVSLAATTSAQTSQTTETLTDRISRKRNLQEEIRSCGKKLRLMEKANAKEITREQFLQGCDKFLSPDLSKIAKAFVNKSSEAEK